MGCTELGRFFSYRFTERISIALISTDGYVCIVQVEIGFNNFPSLWAEKKTKNQIRKVRFSPIFVFWALLLKVQTGITLSIFGVRGSSSNSRELSTIPFNNMPIETLKLKIEKNILVYPKQTVTNSLYHYSVSINFHPHPQYWWPALISMVSLHSSCWQQSFSLVEWCTYVWSVYWAWLSKSRPPLSAVSIYANSILICCRHVLNSYFVGCDAAAETCILGVTRLLSKLVFLWHISTTSNIWWLDWYIKFWGGFPLLLSLVLFDSTSWTVILLAVMQRRKHAS